MAWILRLSPYANACSIHLNQFKSLALYAGLKAVLLTELGAVLGTAVGPAVGTLMGTVFGTVIRTVIGAALNTVRKRACSGRGGGSGGMEQSAKT